MTNINFNGWPQSCICCTLAVLNEMISYIRQKGKVLKYMLRWLQNSSGVNKKKNKNALPHPNTAFPSNRLQRWLCEEDSELREVQKFSSQVSGSVILWHWEDRQEWDKAERQTRTEAGVNSKKAHWGLLMPICWENACERFYHRHH